MTRPTIEQVDIDGAIREAAEGVADDTRAGFLARTAVAAGGLVGGGILLATVPGVAAAASKSDVSILNFALTLEYLEQAFYAEGLARGSTGKGAKLTFATTAHAHESAHVVKLKAVLGSAAIKKPQFDFGTATGTPRAFLSTAVELEDVGVRAYKGQAPNIQSPAILSAALSIHSVEANHAAWARYLAGEDPTYTGAFEKPLTRAQVLAAVKKTQFVVSSD